MLLVYAEAARQSKARSYTPRSDRFFRDDRPPADSEAGRYNLNRKKLRAKTICQLWDAGYKMKQLVNLMCIPLAEIAAAIGNRTRAQRKGKK